MVNSFKAADIHITTLPSVYITTLPHYPQISHNTHFQAQIAQRSPFKPNIQALGIHTKKERATLSGGSFCISNDTRSLR